MLDVSESEIFVFNDVACFIIVWLSIHCGDVFLQKNISYLQLNINSIILFNFSNKTVIIQVIYWYF